MQVVCGSSPEAIPRRLVWCPHVATGDQSTGEGEEDSLLLAVSHGSKVSAHTLRHLLYPEHPYNVQVYVRRYVGFVVFICSMHPIHVHTYSIHIHVYMNTIDSYRRICSVNTYVGIIQMYML